MIGELGFITLLLVAVLSSLLAFYYVIERWFTNHGQADLILPVTRLNALLSLSSLCLLGAGFVTDQFGLEYVASHSNSQLPVFFKVAAIWGGHQGSMLFWVMTLCCWAAIISFHQLSNPVKHKSNYLNDVLWVMNLLIAAFAWFTVFASNPFEPSNTLLAEGRDLNPMLQDVGLIFHPPLLYLGYIGYSTVFAFACAAMMRGGIDHDWLALSRYYVLASWVFLTAGIVLGSWWAYYELGWGGWWFWDPVENASLLPWLTGTALLHAHLAAHRHDLFHRWAIGLSITTFCFSILGTFIVRSGVLTSVHAFAVDPNKGIALLLILVIALLGSLGLLIMKFDSWVSQPLKSLMSRSYLLLLSIGLLVVATFTVFLGTFYPMVYELIGFGNISVGAPYFNTLILPLTALALIVMGFAPLLKWYKGKTVSTPKLILLVCLSIGLATWTYWLLLAFVQYPQVAADDLLSDQFSPLAWCIWVLSMWVCVTHVRTLVMSQFNPKTLATFFAHIGLGIACVGAVMNSEHSQEIGRKLSSETQFSFQQWQVVYHDTHWVIGPNYTAERAEIELIDLNGQSLTLSPERRYYPVRVMNMSEPAIKIFWHGDVYITLGDKLDTNSYAVKIQYKAYIRWVWLGAMLMMLGGIVSAISSQKVRVKQHEEIQVT
ncbi:heme lyase CcmF/NrfE family subunit [uncultured Vibrio sp.]|uniref:heme lyase CcmF/NrfE family subunit n=1 Tax=uncultured Vibrio sp. TaxID=114054 RepID=UPI00091AB15A|nr:heme lyase CcmF/NrfE family subunit [uncultured Vibrio sp.]OIQ25579.1 MAG: cytochrome c nitrate reductase biogenesis protein NrfE [Vibrio sp. MedPE-SWchi]